MCYVCVSHVLCLCIACFACVCVLKLTYALIFSQNASSPERALKMMQFEVGMGSTHTILTHSPAFDVPNGKTKSRRLSTGGGAVFPQGLSRSLSLAKGNPQGSRGGKTNTWLSTLTSRTEQVVPHYVSLVIAAGTAQQSWPALPT